MLWWDETAQLLRRVRSLRSTARQLKAVHEALRRRISTLPRFLESDPSFEFEERPSWCDALHARCDALHTTDEIGDQDLENLNKLFRASLGSLTGVCALGSWRSPHWERERCINGLLGMIRPRASRSKLWTPRDIDCPRPERWWDTGGQNGMLVGSSIGTASISSIWQSLNCAMKFGAGSLSTGW